MGIHPEGPYLHVHFAVLASYGGAVLHTVDQGLALVARATLGFMFYGLGFMIALHSWPVLP